MNCRETKRKMSAYLDGELAMPERNAFFEHLTQCPACCDLMGEASYYEATLSVAMKQRMEAPAAVRQNVMQAIAAQNARRAALPRTLVWPRLTWRPAAAFATVLALAGAGWRTFTQSFQPAPKPAVEAREPARAIAAAPPVSAPRASQKPVAAPAPAPKKPAVAAAPRTAAPALKPAPAVKTPAPTRAARPAPAVKTPAPIKPASPSRAKEPAAPTMLAAAPAPDQPVGTVSYIWAPGNVMNGRFLSRTEATKDWVEASYDLGIRTHLQTSESTVIEMTLKDGTHLKSNESTEFVVQRAPTRDDNSWSIRLVRGNLWVHGVAGVDVEIVAPGASVRGQGSEFSVRSFDGQDSAVIVARGTVTCDNGQGRIEVAAGQANANVMGEAPGKPFAVADLAGQLEWAYRAKEAYSALDNGVLPR